MKKNEKYEKCQECNGAGRIKKKVAMYDGGSYCVTNTCIVCNGSGIKTDNLGKDNPVIRATC